MFFFFLWVIWVGISEGQFKDNWILTPCSFKNGARALIGSFKYSALSRTFLPSRPMCMSMKANSLFVIYSTCLCSSLPFWLTGIEDVENVSLCCVYSFFVVFFHKYLCRCNLCQFCKMSSVCVIKMWLSVYNFIVISQVFGQYLQFAELNNNYSTILTFFNHSVIVSHQLLITKSWPLMQMKLLSQWMSIFLSVQFDWTFVYFYLLMQSLNKCS